jgi:tetratricopeptide (TPR) repeat protein
MRCLILLLALFFVQGCTTLAPHSNLLAMQDEANQTYAAGDFEQAGKLYRSLADALPSDAGVRYQLGNSLARQGNIPAAIDSYREALVRDPQHARAWHNLLQVQLREALLTAGEMHQTLNPQQPMAGRALLLGERLLEVVEPNGQPPVQEP